MYGNKKLLTKVLLIFLIVILILRMMYKGEWLNEYGYQVGKKTVQENMAIVEVFKGGDR